MKKLIILFFLLISALDFTAQSKTVSDFEKTDLEYKKFAYRSVIRMFNKEQNPDFDALVRDLDHVRFLCSKKNHSKSKKVFAQLESGLYAEEYEEIMSVFSAEGSYMLLSRNDHWVALFDYGGYAGLFDLKGSIDTEYLNALSGIDAEVLMEVLQGEINID